MKAFLKNFAIGLPLAFGAMLTLAGVSLALRGGDEAVGGVALGLVGIPLLFATLAALLKE